MKEEKRGKVSEGEAKFIASPKRAKANPVKKSKGCPFFRPFFERAKKENKEKKHKKLLTKCRLFDRDINWLL